MSEVDTYGPVIVKAIFKAEQEKGVSIFFSSHLLQAIEELCQSVVVIHHGRILYNGELKSFMSQFSTLEEAFRSTRKEAP